MFFNVHEKNWEGLVDFGDEWASFVMMHIGMNNYRATAHMTVMCGYSLIIHSNPHHHKPRPLGHQNQPGLPDFSSVR